MPANGRQGHTESHADEGPPAFWAQLGLSPPHGSLAPSPAAGLSALQFARFGPLGASGLPAAQPHGLHRRMAVASEMVVGGWRLPYLPHLRAQATSRAVGAHLGSCKGGGCDDKDREDRLWALLNTAMSYLFLAPLPTQIGAPELDVAGREAPGVHELREAEEHSASMRHLALRKLSRAAAYVDEYKAIAELIGQPRPVAAGPRGSARGGYAGAAQIEQHETCAGKGGEYAAAKRVALLMLAHLRLEQAIRCEELVVAEDDEDGGGPGPSGSGDAGQGAEAGAHRAEGGAPGRALCALRSQHRHRVAACVCCDALLRHLRLPVLLLPELDLVAGMAAEAQAQLCGRWPPGAASGHPVINGFDALLHALLGGCGCGCSSGSGGAAPAGAATSSSAPCGDRPTVPACSTATPGTHTSTSGDKAAGSGSATAVLGGSLCTCWLYSLRSFHLLVTCISRGAPHPEGRGGAPAARPPDSKLVSCMANPLQLTVQFGREYVGAALGAQRILTECLRDTEQGRGNGAREEEGASGSEEVAPQPADGDASSSRGSSGSSGSSSSGSSGSSGSGSRGDLKAGGGGLSFLGVAGRTISSGGSERDEGAEGDRGYLQEEEEADLHGAVEGLFLQVFRNILSHRTRKLADERGHYLVAWAARMQGAAEAGEPGSGGAAREARDAHLDYMHRSTALLGGMLALLRQRSTEQLEPWLEPHQQQEREGQDGAGGLAANGLPACSAGTTSDEGQAAGAGHGGNTSCHSPSPHQRSSAECSPPLSASSPSSSTPSASSPSTSPSCRAPAAPTAGASDATTGCGGDGHSPGLLLLRSASFATPLLGSEPASRGLGSTERHDKRLRCYGAEELAARMALAQAWVDVELDGVPRAVRLEGPLAAHMLLQAAAGATTAWGMVANLLVLAAAEGAPAVGAGGGGVAGGPEPCCSVVLQLGTFEEMADVGPRAAESGAAAGPSAGGAPTASGCVDVVLRPGCPGLVTELLQHLLHKMPYHTLRDKKLHKQLSASLSEHQVALVRCCGPEEAWAALKVLCELRTPLLAGGQGLVVAALEAGEEAGFLSAEAAGAAGETSPVAGIQSLACQHRLQHFMGQAVADLTHLDARRTKGHGRQGLSTPFRELLLPHWRQRWRLAANASTCALLGVLRVSRDLHDAYEYDFGGSSGSCSGGGDGTEAAEQDLWPRRGASTAGADPCSGFRSVAWADTWVTREEKEAVRPRMEPYDGTVDGKPAYGAGGHHECNIEVCTAGLECEALARDPRGRLPLVLVALVAEGGKGGREEEGREGAGARGRDGKGAAGGGGGAGAIGETGPLVLPALVARLRETASRESEMRMRKAMGPNVRRW